MKPAQRTALAVATIALLFWLGLWPALRSSAVYHGDERFYTDAALAMQASGDYSLPRYADGTPRRNKPMLAYWLIAASQQTFGTGLWQARLPFALAGAALVLLTGLLAARLTGDARAGSLAALVMASNPDVLLLSIRSTPDILVCAAVLLALSGLLREESEQSARAAWELWLGAGLAVLAKGLWGVLILGFAFAFTLAVRRDSPRRFVRIPALLTGVALAALGIVPLFASGVGATAEEAAGDQLRAASAFTDVLHNALEYLPAPLIHFLPWTLLLALGLCGRAGREAVRARLARPFARVALLWWALLVVVFLFGAQRRVRYLAPAQALLAVLLVALLLALAKPPSVARRLQSACVVLSGLCALLAFLGARLVAPDSRTAALVLVGLGVVSLAATWLARRGPAERALLCAGVAVACAAVGYQGLARPTLARSPLPAIAARLEREGASGRIALIGLDDAFGARLRLLSEGTLVPEPLASTSARPGELLLVRADHLAEAPEAAELARFDDIHGPDRAELLARLRGAPSQPTPVDPTRSIVLLRRR